MNSRTYYQKAKLNVPVTIKSFARADDIQVHCCYEPDDCSCSNTINLHICMKIPVNTGATVEVGQPFLHCEMPDCSEPQHPKDSAISACNLALLDFLKNSTGNKISLGTLRGHMLRGRLVRLEGKMITLFNGLIIIPGCEPMKSSKITVCIDNIILWQKG